MEKILFMLLTAITLLTNCSEDETINPQNECMDRDNDSVCSDVDCNDNNADIYVGASCDDNRDFTTNDVYTDDCVCEGTWPTMTDPRDGKVYNIATIGNQTWMAENLDYEGGIGVYDCSELVTDFGEPSCSYGRYYKYNALTTACPSGWHVPSKAEWKTLYQTLGNDLSTLGGTLKSDDFLSFWAGDNTGANSSSAFNAYPGGYVFILGSDKREINSHLEANFWSTTITGQHPTNGQDQVYVVHLEHNSAELTEYDGIAHQNYAYSCRCLKD